MAYLEVARMLFGLDESEDLRSADPDESSDDT
jgi:hypothetical protein